MRDAPVSQKNKKRARSLIFCEFCNRIFFSPLEEVKLFRKIFISRLFCVWRSFFFNEGHKNAKVYFRINRSRVKRRNKKILFSNSCFSVFDESIVLFFCFKKLLLTCSKVLPPKFGFGLSEQNNLNRLFFRNAESCSWLIHYNYDMV